MIICVSKILDGTVRLQYKEIEQWIREIRGKRPQEMEEAPILVVSKSGHLINRIVQWEKRVSGDPL